MDIGTTFNSAMQAFQRADEGLRRSADTIARQTGGVQGREDLNTALVEAKTYEVQAKAAVKVVKAADEMLGTLLDTRV